MEIITFLVNKLYKKKAIKNLQIKLINIKLVFIDRGSQKVRDHGVLPLAHIYTSDTTMSLWLFVSGLNKRREHFGNN